MTNFIYPCSFLIFAYLGLISRPNMPILHLKLRSITLIMSDHCLLLELPNVHQFYNICNEVLGICMLEVYAFAKYCFEIAYCYKLLLNLYVACFMEASSKSFGQELWLILKYIQITDLCLDVDTSCPWEVSKNWLCILVCFGLVFFSNCHFIWIFSSSTIYSVSFHKHQTSISIFNHFWRVEPS